MSFLGALKKKFIRERAPGTPHFSGVRYLKSGILTKVLIGSGRDIAHSIAREISFKTIYMTSQLGQSFAN